MTDETIASTALDGLKNALGISPADISDNTVNQGQAPEVDPADEVQANEESIEGEAETEKTSREIKYSSSATKSLVEAALMKAGVPYLAVRVSNKAILLELPGDVTDVSIAGQALVMPGVFGSDYDKPESSLYGVTKVKDLGSVVRTLVTFDRSYAERVFED